MCANKCAQQSKPWKKKCKKTDCSGCTECSGLFEDENEELDADDDDVQEDSPDEDHGEMEEDEDEDQALLQKSETPTAETLMEDQAKRHKLAMKLFKQADVNKDGFVDQDEAVALVADLKKDQILPHAPNGDEMAAIKDASGSDGLLTEAEFEVLVAGAVEHLAAENAQASAAEHANDP